MSSLVFAEGSLKCSSIYKTYIEANTKAKNNYQAYSNYNTVMMYCAETAMAYKLGTQNQKTTFLYKSCQIGISDGLNNSKVDFNSHITRMNNHFYIKVCSQ